MTTRNGLTTLTAALLIVASGCAEAEPATPPTSAEVALRTLRADGTWQRVDVRARETRRLAVTLDAGEHAITWTDHYGYRPGRPRPRCTLDVRVVDRDGRALTETAHNASQNDNGAAPDPLLLRVVRRTEVRIELREIDGYADDVEIKVDRAAGDAFGAPPEGLVVHTAGDVTDDARPTTRPAIGLAGGGPDHEGAMRALLEAAGHGDVVVLRMNDTGGAYATWFRSLGARSVRELVFDADAGNAEVAPQRLAAVRARADARWTEQIVNRAEMVFIAGGNQTKYADAWRDTALARAVTRLARRGVVGGTSAGMHVLAGVVHTPRGAGDSVTSGIALRDPYIRPDEHRGTASLDLGESPFTVAPLAGWIADTHWSQRDRLGRSLVFLARALVDGARPLGEVSLAACDEGVAVVIDEPNRARVFAPPTGGGASFFRPDAAPEVCADNRPLEWRAGVPVLRVEGTPTGARSVDLARLSSNGAALRRAYVVAGRVDIR